jgi:hypothetical protein
VTLHMLDGGAFKYEKGGWSSRDRGCLSLKLRRKLNRKESSLHRACPRHVKRMIPSDKGNIVILVLKGIRLGYVKEECLINRILKRIRTAPPIWMVPSSVSHLC